ncbi:MAG: hypothetical protein FWE77_03105 [Clostridia bacterium]|nr:hypothetical protein [Clostridia bacterium]
MRFSTFRGLAAGGVMGVAVGAAVMLMPQGRKLKRALNKSGAVLRRQMTGMWDR